MPVDIMTAGQELSDTVDWTRRISRKDAEPWLLANYAHINQTTFLERLPLVTIRFGCKGALARVWYSPPKPTTIMYFASYLLIRPKLVLRELLHETVHVAHPNLRHGPDFQGEMLRINWTAYPDYTSLI